MAFHDFVILGLTLLSLSFLRQGMDAGPIQCQFYLIYEISTSLQTEIPFVLFTPLPPHPLPNAWNLAHR